MHIQSRETTKHIIWKRENFISRGDLANPLERKKNNPGAKKVRTGSDAVVWRLVDKSVAWNELSVNLISLYE